MDFPRLSTSPSVNYERNMPSHSFASPGPMRIPNKTVEAFAPPPLPPPQRINDLENGHDVGWLHANGMGRPDITKLAPINPGSSLLGGHRPPEPIPRIERMSLDDHVKIELPKQHTFQSSYSSNFSEPMLIDLGRKSLQGERDFSRRCVMSSSDSYDRHLLSKIGKTNSPHRASNVPAFESRGQTAASLSHSTSLGTSYQPSSMFEQSNSLVNYAVSPGGHSPRSKASWKDTVEYRSPSVESSAPSTGIELDSYSTRRQTGTVTPQSEDTFSFFSRSGRPYQEQSVFPDVECEDDNDQLRQHLTDHTHTAVDIMSRQHGMKRRASSPPREPIIETRHALHKATSNSDLAQRRAGGNLFTSHIPPSSRHLPSHGSLSSMSSGSWRTSASLSSSSGLSAATSVSSYDPLNQPSPGGSIHGLPGSKVSYYNGGDSKTSLSNRKISLQSGIGGSRSGGSKMGGLYICDCCPKKPKKFETQEELRTHELEKQYTCQFCKNRFKNKNEAERHQNSLHLRRHSWSCAALSSYQSAFHPSTSPAAQTSMGASHDTCGYCGEEFPNNPQPDWDQRFEHLTSMHKFGECNNVKKFFRADHFRQHLKHSHAGTPGKWTNILENACMKEEPPQSESRLEIISEKGSSTRSDANGAGSTKLSSSTINEVMNES
ncbi:hypothetical protein UA08_05690 [Talaromyces atroroseus]|uniref:C2H2-type domain-containing protein n=1 Tax=Talaromyces atroroseus TaxID=1441469 RepID=A0A225AI53_TALAT|nr:hypothetical protein UA08_05690 [Talaromyces atroroseus]OKL58993.1 hypothetical protein UA08_05690 [Talaromyces atroroseus]